MQWGKQETHTHTGTYAIKALIMNIIKQEMNPRRILQLYKYSYLASLVGEPLGRVAPLY